jgi:peroxiredoxin
MCDHTVYAKRIGGLLQPTFTVADKELYKRLTLVVENGRIQKVFYPVFPPDQSGDEVIAWMRQNAQLDAAGDAPKSAHP